MCDTSGHLTDRSEPLPKPRVALELLEVGDVLKCEQQSGISAGRLQLSRCEPQLDLPSISGSIGGFDAPAAPGRRAANEIGGDIRRQLEHILDAAAGDRLRSMPRNSFGRPVEREDPSLVIRCREPLARLSMTC